MLIGDRLERILAAIGITAARIESITGKGCGCSKRKAALNKRHNDLKVWWRMRKADMTAMDMKRRRIIGEARSRIAMAWKSLRYGNPHYVALVAAASVNARKEAQRATKPTA